jgi:hypothetical protein
MAAMAPRLHAALAALLLACSNGCTTPATEALIRVETDIPADRAVAITITAADPDAGTSMHALWSFDAGRADGGHRIASFAVVPGHAPRDAVVSVILDAVVESRASTEPPLALRRRASFRLVPGRTLDVPIFLSVQCLLAASGCTTVPLARCTRSVRCEEQGETCGGQGECIAVAVDSDGGLDAGDVPHACVPMCTARNCGDDGCGGSCGTCPVGQTCDALAGQCVCAPMCVGRECGPDGCGRVCGACPTESACGGDGICHPTCGGPAQPCCTLSAPCGMGLMCNGATHTCSGACGTSGLACCPGGTCAAPLVCRAGACASCPGGTTACSASCVNLNTDVQNCGRCGNVCGAGLVCVGGACQCAPPTVACGTSCVDLATDAAHCGSCTNACATGQSCCSSACTDTTSDVNNCGACGHACGSGFLCVAGACMPCGQSSQLCCAMMTCAVGLACELSRFTRDDRCTACGAAGEVCCAGSSCNAGAVCSSGFCAACGRESQPCCAGNSCSAGFTCNSTRTDIQFGCIRCGGGGEPCCVAGPACNSGYACSAITAGTNLCTTSTANVPGGPCTAPPDPCTGASFCRNNVCYACAGFDLFCCGNVMTGACNAPYSCHALTGGSAYACW